MRTEREVYRFGPFELDPARPRLIRGREPVALPARHVNVLLLLVSNAGHIVTKDAVSEAGWQDPSVTDNSITQVISNLRKALGRQKDGTPYITTMVGRGYQFVAPVNPGQRRPSRLSIETVLAPHRAFVDGRAWLETLDREAVTRARQAFEEALRAAPDYPAAHIGLANACVLDFDATRTDMAPDLAALEQADRHARHACRLQRSSADAWCALAVVLHRTGRAGDAVLAAREAIRLEPKEWRHHLRLASVSWGAERLHATQHVLTQRPGLALAYWFEAAVFVARGAFDAALESLRDGCAAQDEPRTQDCRFTAVGLHFLHGLVLAARGAVDGALEEFTRELASLGDGRHVYARECAANTWYARGALHLREGRRDEADPMFHEALTCVPGHPLAAVGLAALSPFSYARVTGSDANTVDAAVVKAAVLALEGKHHDAARLCLGMLAQAPPGSAGWLLPVEPLLYATAHREAWAQTLLLLRDRAT